MNEGDLIRVRQLLNQKYIELQNMYENALQEGHNNINLIIRNSLNLFLEKCKRPAIWCYGKHTKMLMADFMFELKSIHYIIDNGIENRIGSGFEIISEREILERGIDGIIISSRIYKNEIIDNLEKNYNHIIYLDIYKEIEKEGIRLEKDYYVREHPYSKYCSLNELQRNILHEKSKEVILGSLKHIIRIYIEIKDFKTAISYAERMVKLSNGSWEIDLLKKLNEIYRLQLEALERINEDNVLMLCIDGLRRNDVCDQYMRNMYSFIVNNTYHFDNAYSISSSTFESLIPAYSENSDLRTRYYEKNKINSAACRFIKEAKRKNCNIFFYTDGTDYVDDAEIKVSSQFQTATEKWWGFLMDAIDEERGLFYIHILYESHYSYPNPYTDDVLIAEGTNILFDYLDKNGGEIRTDYSKQHRDSLKYLDDVIVPFLVRLSCRSVLYADHGNIILEKGTNINDIEKTKFTYHEDLIQVPLAIKCPEMPAKVDSYLTSIMELNNILLGLLNRKEISFARNRFIKVVRSQIYNPDFKYLYKRANFEHELLAFEVFIFEDGYKLAIYQDGKTELYNASTDYKINNLLLQKKLLRLIQNEITVCDIEEINIKSVE